MELTENILNIIKESNSIREVLIKLNFVATGSNYKNFKRFLKDNNIDVSHFVKNKNKSNNSEKRQLEDYLNNKYPIQSHALKLKLIKANILKHECSVCHLTEWNDKPIPIDLDHINGNHNDNTLSNLRILCPNCHAKTDNYCSKNAKNFKPKTIYSCAKCNIELSQKTKSGHCIKCMPRSGFKHLKRIEWTISPDELLEMVKQSNFTEVGKKLGVSQKSIRNRLKEFGKI